LAAAVGVVASEPGDREVGGFRRLWGRPCDEAADSDSIVSPYWLTSGFIPTKPPPVAVSSMNAARSAREIRGPLSRPIGPAW